MIRGTSKFFSTPGIRLGYGLIGNCDVKNKINDNLDLWNKHKQRLYDNSIFLHEENNPEIRQSLSECRAPATFVQYVRREIN